MERLVDLTGSVSRVGDNVCARAYYANIGCVDAARGTLLWTKPAVWAPEGLSGDERFLYGTEENGNVVAWRRDDGERAWQGPSGSRTARLTAPLAVGRSLIIGDSTGLLHFVSRDDGAPLNRLTPDGSAIAAAPVLSGNTVVVVTRNGGVFGYRPEMKHPRSAHFVWPPTPLQGQCLRPAKPVPRHSWNKPSGQPAMKPVVAIVGRPNVGKSTLFNRLTKRRDAIVADFAGLTRDRHYGDGRLGEHEFIVVDTGGFEPDSGQRHLQGDGQADAAGGGRGRCSDLRRRCPRGAVGTGP